MLSCCAYLLLGGFLFSMQCFVVRCCQKQLKPIIWLFLILMLRVLQGLPEDQSQSAVSCYVIIQVSVVRIVVLHSPKAIQACLQAQALVRKVVSSFLAGRT